MSVRVNYVVAGKGDDNFLGVLALSNIKNTGSNFSIRFSNSPIRKDIDFYHYYDVHLVGSPIYPAICSIYPDVSEIKKRFESLKGKLDKMQKILCLNEAQKNYLAKQGFKNTEIVPLAVNKKIYNVNEPKKVSGKIVIGIIKAGKQIYPQEYIADLCKALSNKDYAFFIVGDGLEELAFKLKSFGLDVEYFPRMPENLMPQIFNAISVMFHFSASRNQLKTLAEAVAMAVPIISCTKELLGNYVQYGVNGVFLKKDAALDAKVFEELKNGLLNKLMEAAFEKRKEVLSTEQLTQKLCGFYTPQMELVNAS